MAVFQGREGLLAGASGPGEALWSLIFLQNVVGLVDVVCRFAYMQQVFKIFDGNVGLLRAGH